MAANCWNSVHISPEACSANQDGEQTAMSKLSTSSSSVSSPMKIEAKKPK